MPLTPKQKQQLKAHAHSLKPVVLLGQHGLTEAVHHEIEQALLDHELIKVRIPGVDRDERQQSITIICQTHHADLVQAIGHVVVLYRKNKE
jgi:RNA-binding protein